MFFRSTINQSRSFKRSEIRTANSGGGLGGQKLAKNGQKLFYYIAVLCDLSSFILVFCLRCAFFCQIICIFQKIVVPLQPEHSTCWNLDWGVPGWKGLFVRAILFLLLRNDLYSSHFPVFDINVIFDYVIRHVRLIGV